MNTLWCLIGCSIGDFGTIYYFQVYPNEFSTMTIMILAVINGLITSIVLETIINSILELNKSDKKSNQIEKKSKTSHPMFDQHPFS